MVILQSLQAVSAAVDDTVMSSPPFISHRSVAVSLYLYTKALKSYMHKVLQLRSVGFVLLYSITLTMTKCVAGGETWVKLPPPITG